MAIDPIFSHDFHQFVFQDPDVKFLPNRVPPPFKLEAPQKTEKSKKEMKKKKK